MRAYERLIKYAEVHTTSQDGTGTTPSTARQLQLAKMLTQELIEIGFTNAHTDEYGYVYASAPATPECEQATAVGFIAHMDTAPAFSGEHVKVLEWRGYDGGDVHLPQNGTIISAEAFPQLKKWAGRTLLTADGSTLLGADDKAGIAEIMTAAAQLLNNGKPHGKICIAFTPDEEIGEGADHFDVEKFGADIAYTIDGDVEGDINYENFNAASAKIHIDGVSVHPGSAKGIMVNALLLAAEINANLPAAERPEHTDNYEGFYMLEELHGDSAAADMLYIIRDHDGHKFAQRKEKMAAAVKTVAEKYPTAGVVCSIKDSYYNMAERISDCMHMIDNAKLACEQAGVTPFTKPIRGGTDGSRLSFMGLPCPNLGTGGINFHGPYECITAEGMDTVVNIILNLVDIYAEN